MIRKQNTCRAYAIRPYSDGRKKLFLRSILGYVKQRDPFFNPKKGYAESIIYLFELRKGYERWHNPFFDLKNVHAESIIYLFELKKGYARWHDPFLDPKNGYAKWHNLFLIIKRIMRNGIFGIFVGAYCIRPLKTFSRETYDQKYRYMWGVCNTPLP